jgi:hypothetical protein
VNGALIPIFAPHLAGVRTVSAKGAGSVPATFTDLYRTVLFVHLDDPSHRRAWVIVDGDDAGRAAQQKLINQYRDWPPARFITLDQPHFERYYPPLFSHRVEEIADMPDKRQRWSLKGTLARDVTAWAMENIETARSEFEASAAPVIEILRSIEEDLS